MINSILDMYNPMDAHLTLAQARNYCSRWYVMEHEFSAHDESYFLQAKSFFYRISYLSSQERKQLAYIYYYPHPSDRPSSEDICKHFGFGSNAKVTDFKNKLLAKILKPVYKPFKQHQRDMDEIRRTAI